MKNKKLIVKYDSILFDYLKENLSGLSKNSIKSLMHDKKIFVNGKNNISYDYNLKKDDLIEIKETMITYNNIKIDIIYEDNDIIVINKPSKLLSIASSNEKELTAYHIVMNYLKNSNKNNKIFVIHRLDKDTSGVLMFAKSKKIKDLFQNNWNRIVLERKYYAVIEGKLSKKEGTIKSYLKEDNNYKVHSSNTGKLAITVYKVIKENDNYSLLDIDIKTGRKNQIRVHFSEMGKPIVGDKKYASKVNNRLLLHAYKLKLIDPRDNKELIFKIKMPILFKNVI